MTDPEQRRRQLLDARRHREAERLEERLGRCRRYPWQVQHSVTFHNLLDRCLRLVGLHAHGRRNALRPRLLDLEFRFPDLPAPFAGYRLLHLSDLHADALPELGHVIADHLRDFPADLCVMTGDYRYDAQGGWDEAMAAMRRILAAVRAPDGIVGVLGNHDVAAEIPDLQALGARILQNEALCLRRAGAELWLAGVDDPYVYETADLDLALDGVPPESFRILLAHTPDLRADARRHDIRLYLCGHTHAGQIRLPGVPPLVTGIHSPRRFAHGVWEDGPVQGYTSSGIGASCVPVRFCCPPEIVRITLRQA